jgi:hypothetical protein
MLHPFWEALLLAGQGQLQVKESTNLMTAVAVHLNNEKRRKIYMPLLKSLTSFNQNHFPEADRTMNAVIKRTHDRGTRKILKVHWKKAKQQVTKRQKW